MSGARDSAIDQQVANTQHRQPFFPSNAPFRILCICQYCLVVTLFWPSFAFAPSSLDDYSQLDYAAGRTFAQTWDYDKFGHFRPIKNILFWLLSHSLEHVGSWRVAIFAVFTASMVIVQVIASRLLGSQYAGLVAAALWALNPTTATTVCWLSTGNLALCLLGIATYLCLAVRELELDHTPWNGRLTLAMLGLLFAEFCHELALLTPIALLVYRRTFSVIAKPRWAHPVHIGTALCIASFAALRAWTNGTTALYRTQSEPAWQLVSNAARYFATNTRSWFLPNGRFGVLLSDTPNQHLVGAVVWWVALMIVAIAAWKLRRRDRAISLGLAWFGLFLVPVSNFVPLGNTPVAPHYLYVPGVGLALALTRALQLFYGHIDHYSPRSAVTLSVGLMISISLVWLPETARVIAAWQNDETLFGTTLKNYPEAIEPMINLASFDIREQRYAQAKTLLERAQRLAPKNTMVLRNMFSLLWQTDQPQAALNLLDQYPELSDEPEFLIRRGDALDRLGRQDAARVAFQRAFEGTEPETPSEDRFVAGYRLMVASLRAQEVARARELAQRLLQEYPTRRELEPARELLRDGDSN